MESITFSLVAHDDAECITSLNETKAFDQTNKLNEIVSMKFVTLCARISGVWFDSKRSNTSIIIQSTIMMIICLFLLSIVCFPCFWFPKYCDSFIINSNLQINPNLHNQIWLDIVYGLTIPCRFLIQLHFATNSKKKSMKLFDNNINSISKSNYNYHNINYISEHNIKYLKRSVYSTQILYIILNLLNVFWIIIEAKRFVEYSQYSNILWIIFVIVSYSIAFLFFTLPNYPMFNEIVLLFLKYDIPLRELIFKLNNMYDGNDKSIDNEFENECFICLYDISCILSKLENNYKNDWDNPKNLLQYWIITFGFLVFWLTWTATGIDFERYNKNDSTKFLISVQSFAFYVLQVLSCLVFFMLFYFGASMTHSFYKLQSLLTKMIISEEKGFILLNDYNGHNYNDICRFSINKFNRGNTSNINNMSNWRLYLKIQNMQLKFKLFGVEISYSRVLKSLIVAIVAKCLSLGWDQTVKD